MIFLSFFFQWIKQNKTVMSFRGRGRGGGGGFRGGGGGGGGFRGGRGGDRGGFRGRGKLMFSLLILILLFFRVSLSSQNSLVFLEFSQKP